MTKRRLTWIPGILLFAIAGPLSAHDLYLMPEKFVTQGGTRLRVVFQNGDEFPEATSPVKPERLRNMRLISRAGAAEFETITAKATRTTAMVRVRGEGSATLTANTIPSVIEIDAAKFRSYLEHENLTETIKWREAHGEASKPGREQYSKYVKSIILVDKGDEYYRERTGLLIEIVPEVDPYSVRPGQSLPVQVLFRGKPTADVAVESAWLEKGKAKTKVVGRTDSNGRIRVPLEAIGPHRLHAIAMERYADPKVADWESFWASLTFEIQGGR